jgi:uncharacterized protein (TIGR02147 family)
VRLVSDVKYPRLKNYQDYRLFLRDFAAFAKASKKGWSYTVWAKSMGLKSKASLIMICNGARVPSADLVERLLKYFQFSKSDGNYFKTLVATTRMREAIHIMDASQKPNLEDLNLTEAESAILSTWFCFVVKECAVLLPSDTPDFFKRIATAIGAPVTATQVEFAVESLIKAKLIRLNPTSAPTKYSLESRPRDLKWTQHLVRCLHEDGIAACKKAFETRDPVERVFQTSFIRMKLERVQEAKVFIKEFQNRFSQQFDDIDADEIFQLNLQYFPVTRGLK